MDTELAEKQEPSQAAIGLPVILTQQDASILDAPVASRRLSAPLRCKVSGCTSDLKFSPKTHQRFRLCNTHIKSPAILVDGIASRFCQQCSRFHPLADFHGTNRTCRMMLIKNRARQRVGAGGGGGGAAGLGTAARECSPPPSLPLIFTAGTAAVFSPAPVAFPGPGMTASGGTPLVAMGLSPAPVTPSAWANGQCGGGATAYGMQALHPGDFAATAHPGGTHLHAAALHAATAGAAAAATVPAAAAGSIACCSSSATSAAGMATAASLMPAEPQQAAQVAFTRPSFGLDSLTSHLLEPPYTAATVAVGAVAFACSTPHSAATAVSEPLCPLPRVPSALALPSGCDDMAAAVAATAAVTSAPLVAATGSFLAEAAAASGAVGAPNRTRSGTAPCFARDSSESVGTAAAAQALNPSGGPVVAAGAPVTVWEGTVAAAAAARTTDTGKAGSAAAPALFLATMTDAGIGAAGRLGRPPTPAPAPPVASLAATRPSPFARCSAPPDLCYSGAAGLDELLRAPPQHTDAAAGTRSCRQQRQLLSLALQQQQQHSNDFHHQALSRLKPTLQRELSLQHVLWNKQHSSAVMGCDVRPGDGSGVGGRSASGPAGDGDAWGGDLVGLRSVSFGDATDGGLGRGRCGAGGPAAAAAVTAAACGSGPFARISAPPESAAAGLRIMLRCGSGSSASGRRFAALGAGSGPAAGGDFTNDGGELPLLQRSGSFGSFKRRRSSGCEAAAEGEGSASVRHCSSTGLCEPDLDAGVAAVRAAATERDSGRLRDTRSLQPAQQEQLLQGQQEQLRQQCGGAMESDWVPEAAGYSTTPPTSDSWSLDGMPSRTDSPGGEGDGSSGGAAAAGGSRGGASPLGRPPLQLAAACGPLPSADDRRPLTPGEATSLFLGALVLDEKVIHDSTAATAAATMTGRMGPALAAAAAGPGPMVGACVAATGGGGGSRSPDSVSASEAAVDADMLAAVAAPAAQPDNLNQMLASLAAEWRCEGGSDCGDDLTFLLGPDGGAAALRRDFGDQLPAWAPPALRLPHHPAVEAGVATATGALPASAQAHTPPQSSGQLATVATSAAVTAAGGPPRALPAFARGSNTEHLQATTCHDTAPAATALGSGPGATASAALLPPPVGRSTGGVGHSGEAPSWVRSVQSEPAWWTRPNAPHSAQPQEQGQGRLQWLSCPNHDQLQPDLQQWQPGSLAYGAASTLQSGSAAGGACSTHGGGGSSCSDGKGGGDDGGGSMQDMAVVLRMLDSDAACPPPAAPGGAPAVQAAAAAPAERHRATLPPWGQQQGGERRRAQAPGGGDEARVRGRARKAVGEETEEQLQLLLGDLIGRRDSPELTSPAPPLAVAPSPPPAQGLWPVQTEAHLRPNQSMPPLQPPPQPSRQQHQQVGGPRFGGCPGSWIGSSGAAGSEVKGEADVAVAPLGPQCPEGDSALRLPDAACGPPSLQQHPKQLPRQDDPQRHQRPRAAATSALARRGGGGRRGQRSAADGDGGAATALPDREFLDLALQQQRQLWDELRAMQEQQTALLRQQIEQQRALAKLLRSPRLAAAAAAGSARMPSPSHRQQQQQQLRDDEEAVEPLEQQSRGQLEGSTSCSSSHPHKYQHSLVSANAGAGVEPAFGRWSMPVLRGDCSDEMSAMRDPQGQEEEQQQQQHQPPQHRQPRWEGHEQGRSLQDRRFTRFSQPPEPQSHKRQHSLLRETSLPVSMLASNGEPGACGGSGRDDGGGGGASGCNTSGGSEQGSAAPPRWAAPDGPSALAHPRLAWLQQQQ